jgi:two-component system, NarL family, sensor histidine kinase BarA
VKRSPSGVRNNLQLRLLLIGSLPLLLVTALLTSYAIFIRQGDALHRVESFGTRTADYLANTLDFAFFVLDAAMLAEIAADIEGVPGIRGVGFLDRQRRLLHASAGFPAAGDGLHLDRPLGPEPLRIGDALILEREVRPRAWQVDDYANPRAAANPVPDAPLGWVVVALDLAEVRQARQAILVSSLGLGAAVLGTALLIALALSRSVVAPVRRLTETVARLRQGDLEARVQPSTQDELAQLAEGINHLGESVARSRHELEQRVQQATGELRQTLAALREKNRELEIASERAESANRAKSDFLARMSHELRTPLTAVQGFIRLLESSLPDAADRSYCRIIDQAAISLMALIDDILEFARLQANPRRAPPAPLALREPLEAAVSLLAPTAHDKGVEIHLDIDPHLPEVMIGDARALRQIVNNLVGNAVKFTTAGHVLVQCRQQADQRLEIRVRDTGIGIAPEQQREIFEAFQQADSGVARRFGGTGLGLAIARHHVEQLGGNIELRSSPGEGSEFRVVLPCQWQAGEAAGPRCPGTALVYDPDDLGRQSTLQSVRRIYQDVRPVGSFDDLIDVLASQPIAALNFNWSLGEPPARQLASLRHLLDELRCPIAVQVPLSVLHDIIPGTLLNGRPQVHWLAKPATLEGLKGALCAASLPHDQQAADLAGVRVLVVEDNGFSRQLLGALLERTGCDRCEAADGKAAVEICARQEFDVILMDLHMPEVAGVEALASIQRPGALNAETPVIVLTADQMLDAGRELRRVRVEQILTKPYDERRLFDALLTLTGRGGLPPADWFGSSAALSRDLYFDEIDRLLTALEASLTSRDPDAARDACHQLAGVVAVFKLGQIEQQARLLHSLVRVSDWERAAAMVIRLRLENRTQRYAHRRGSG